MIALLASLALAGPAPDVLIVGAEVATVVQRDARPVPQGVVVYQPGALAVTLSDAVALRPAVAAVIAPWGVSVSAGVQLVWVRRRGRR